jgi:hypothetical protein
MRARLHKLVTALLGSAPHAPFIRRAALLTGLRLGRGSIEELEELASSLPEGATEPPAQPASSPSLARYIEHVAGEAWRITDEDIATLKTEGLDEDTIFEATIAAALGAGIARYQVALRALGAAAGRAQADG